VTIFGHYYDRIKDEFPQKRQLKGVEVSVEVGAGTMAQHIREAGMRMQFIRSDESAMVQVAPNLLVVNQLRPYSSWKDFKASVLHRLADYVAIAEPAGIKRVGLRYINRFEFDEVEFDFARLFAASPYLPPGLKDIVGPFFLRVEVPKGETDRLLLTMGTVDPAEESQVAILLDLDHVSLCNLPVEEEVLSAHLDLAHQRVEEAFESCLTAELRERMNREE